MAWGLWNKIKNGFRKAGKVVRNVARTITDKVIKPFKPVISGVANAINPTLGKAVDYGMNSVERFSDDSHAARPTEGWGSAASWAKNRFGRRP